MKLNTLVACAAATALTSLAWTGAANAAGVITDPTNSYAVGIGNNGELYDFATGVGFLRFADGYDPLAPGTPRDSWGVETILGSAYADQADFGQQNIVGTGFAFGANAAAAATVTTVGVNVSQSYTFAAANIVRVQETVTNTSGTYLSGTVFQRDVDWDVVPTPFNENTTGPFGASGMVIDSSYYGFENPDPSLPYAFSCFAGCNATGDLGGGINVALGNLAPGASTTFDYYYGISQPGQNLNGLVAQAFGVGAAYIIGTQSSENGAYPFLGYNSAFIAVGGVVPEPSAWALMLVGIGALGATLRGSSRRRAALAG